MSTTVFTLIRLAMTTTAPVTIAASSDTEGIDRPVARTPDGTPWIPPSGIAGALREHLADCGLDPVEWMGGADDDESKLTPSPIRIVHTDLRLAADVRQRKQTAVDRRSGAAQGGSLRNSEHLPAGATVTVDLLIDGEHRADGALATALSSFSPVLGSSRTNGLGGTELTSVRGAVVDLSTPTGLAAWLAGGGPGWFEQLARDAYPVAAADEPDRLSIRFRTVDPLFLEPADGDRKRPASRGDDDKGKNTVASGTVLHGSSLKGILRSRAEFILRSLAPEAGADDAAAATLAERLFGSTSRRGRIRCLDAPVEVKRREGREERPHVAIDRFTGGAAPGRLFAEDVIADGTLTLTVEFLDAPDDWERDLIGAVFADIADGYVGLGGRTGRGYGTVRPLEPIEMPDLTAVVTALQEADHV